MAARSPSKTQTLLTLALVVAALYFARQILMPVALAILLTFLLAPLVIRLRRAGMGRIPSVFVVVVLAFALIFGIGAVVATQVYDLASDLPNYQQNLEQKLHALTSPNGGMPAHLNSLFHDLGAELAEELPSQPAPGTTAPAVVQTLPPPSSPLEMLSTLLSTIGGPLATAGIVVIFTMFMLIEREDLRDRLIRLVGRGNLNITTQALDDAAQRVSRYLRMQLLVNVAYGLPIGVGLYFIGVPNAFLWGLLAMLLRFIPYLGVWMAAVVPVLLCIAVDPGWLRLGETIGLYVVMELICANFVEPWLYGSNTGVSSIGVLLAALFWSWLWGTVGLLLSTPLTVCVVVLGRYVPQLRFFCVMLGDQPGLSPPERYYQRMLASEFEDVTDLVDDFLKDHSMGELYESIIVPALILAEQDRHQGQLEEANERFMLEHTRDLIEDLATRHPTGGLPIAVACVPARDEADELCALMLVHLLQLKGVGARALSADRLSGERLEKVADLEVGLVCVSGLPPAAITHARFMGKRLRSAMPELKIVTGLWHVKVDAADLRTKLTPQAVDTVVTTLAQAVDTLVALALVVPQGKAPPREEQAPSPAPVFSAS